VSDSVDFRDVSAALHRAALEQYTIDLAAHRFELTAINTHAGRNERVSLIFEGVIAFEWHSKPANAGAAGDSGSLSASSVPIEPSVVGLERLGSTEPWRLYMSLSGGSELELTCTRILSGEVEVTGVGRSYRT